MNEQQILERIAEIKRNRKKFFELSSLVWRLRELRPDDWAQLLKSVRIGLRVAQYHLSVHRVKSRTFTDVESYEYLGVSKIALMCEAGVFGVSNEQNEYWAAEAESMTTMQLLYRFQHLEPKRARTIMMSEKEHALVEATLLKAGMTIRGKNRRGQGRALVRICKIFLAQHAT